MKVIIAGSRSIESYDIVCCAIQESNFDITTVISGTANGVDKLGELYANNNNIDIVRLPADWRKHGNAAGFIRNEQMAKRGEALIAVWDGKSRGTKHMIDLANKYNLKIYVKKVKPIDIFDKHELYDRSLLLYKMWIAIIKKSNTLEYNIKLKDTAHEIEEKLFYFTKEAEKFRNNEDTLSEVDDKLKIF